MRFCDFVRGPRGVLTVEVFRRGELVERWEGNNLVVDASKPVLAHLLGGAVSGMSVTKFGVGTSLAPAASGNTSLTAPFVKNVDSVVYPSPSQVSFLFTLGTGEANGMNIGEFGLLTTAGALFARRVRSVALPKDSDITLSGAWVINW